MTNFLNENKLDRAQNIINDMNIPEGAEIKRIKNDKGLIERTEANKKIILVEDNRQIICG